MAVIKKTFRYSKVFLKPLIPPFCISKLIIDSLEKSRIGERHCPFRKKGFDSGINNNSRLWDSADGQQCDIIKLIRLANVFLKTAGNPIEQVDSRVCRRV